MSEAPSRPAWPRSRAWFSGCAREEELLTGAQAATLGWLIRVDWPAVWPVGSTFDTLGWAMARDGPGAMLHAHDVPGGARVAITPLGPTIWVPGARSFDYRASYRTFLRQYGFIGELSGLDVDHVMSRGAYYRRRQALTGRSAEPRREWFLLMAAKRQRNRHWGRWEGRARVTGMLGFMSILKSLDQPSPRARDRADGFAGYAEAMADLVTPLLAWPERSVLPSGWRSGTPEALAAQELGLIAGQLIDTCRWVAWAIMAEAIETLGD